MKLITEALAALQRRNDELMPHLESWVRQNSYSANVAGVNRVGEMLIEAFSLPGLSLQRTPGNGVGDHLVWTTDCWNPAATNRIVLIGHHDTVFPEGTFECWECDGDRLRGPGVLDMKGGLGVVRTALASLADVGVLARLPLAMVSVADEEIGSTDSRSMVEDVCRGAAGALVFEAGRAQDAIITQRKGTGRFVVEVTGKAAHAGNHHAEGINAITALARFVGTVSQLTDYDRGITVNVGLIRGGSSANTVPASANCEIDFRFVRKADGEFVVSRCDHVAREVAKSSGARFVLRGGIRRPPLERSDRSVALFSRYGASARQAGLGDSECPLIGGGSDANNISAIGVPAIDGLGPRGAGFHTHDEYIEVPSLALRAEALLRFLLDWLEDVEQS